jgi:hypothetical protein
MTVVQVMEILVSGYGNAHVVVPQIPWGGINSARVNFESYGLSLYKEVLVLWCIMESGAKAYEVIDGGKSSMEAKSKHWRLADGPQECGRFEYKIRDGVDTLLCVNGYTNVRPS